MEIFCVNQNYREGFEKFIHSPCVNSMINRLGFKESEVSTQNKVIGIAAAIFLTCTTLYGIYSFLNRQVTPQAQFSDQNNISFPSPTSNSIQTSYPRMVRNYTGDLNREQKESITCDFKDNILVLNFGVDRPLNVSIRAEDLFASRAQVIINSANMSLAGGGGIDGAIHQKGGKDYEAAHAGLRNDEAYKVSYKMGHANMITSGQLKQSYQIENVIVVAGPNEDHYRQGPPFAENSLYSCYYNSLLLASQEKKTSIAFPSISTGISQFPKERAVEISLKALYDFIHQFPESTLETISIHFLPRQVEELYVYSRLLARSLIMF